MNTGLIKGNTVKVDMEDGITHIGKVLNVGAGWVLIGLKRGGNARLEIGKIKNVWEFGY